MMKRIASALMATAFIAGCSSGVDLDTAAADGKNGAPLSTTDNGANSANAGQSGVAGVDLSQSGRDAAGPADVSRILYFDYDSYIIKADYQAVIESHARFIKTNPARKVMLEGHTDERGGREYNLALGQKRAEAVSRALGLLGVPSTQIEAVSFGKEKPAVAGYTEDAYAQNRRVELSYR